MTTPPNRDDEFTAATAWLAAGLQTVHDDKGMIRWYWDASLAAGMQLPWKYRRQLWEAFQARAVALGLDAHALRAAFIRERDAQGKTFYDARG